MAQTESQPDSTPIAGQSSFPEASTVFVRDGSSWSELSGLGTGAYRVRLGGPFPAGWMASLGSGLAERRVSIDQVHAKRTYNGSWVAELHVVSLDGAADPCGLSYIGLASERWQVPAGQAPLQLESWDLAVEPGGTLRLRFDAPDSLGLLGVMLCKLATLSLFPTELHIETHDGRARDCLWLASAGAMPPTPEDRLALEQLLSGSMRCAGV